MKTINVLDLKNPPKSVRVEDVARDMFGGAPTPQEINALRSKRLGKTLAEYARDFQGMNSMLPTMEQLESFVARCERAAEPPPVVNKNVMRAANEARERNRLTGGK